MSAKRYYFNEGINDNNIKRLIKISKFNIFNHIDYMVEIYEKHSDVKHGPPPIEPLFQMSLNNRKVLSPSPEKYRNSPQDDRVASSLETLNQASPTLLKRNQSASSIPRRHLQFDSANNEALLKATSSSEKQSNPEKILNAAYHDIEAQKHFPVDETIQTATTNRRKQSNPVKFIQTASDQERLITRKRKNHLTSEKIIENIRNLNFPRQHRVSHHIPKLVDNLERVNFVPNTTVRQKTVSNSPRETDKVISSEFDLKYNISTAQSAQMAGNLEAEKRKHVEITELYAVYPVDYEINESYSKEVKGVSDLASEDERDISPLDVANTRSNKKYVSPKEKTRHNANPDNLEEFFSSPVKKAEIPINTSTNIQKYICSGEKTKMLVGSDKYSKLNIKTNQGSEINEDFEGKRKLPGLKRDTMPLKIMPRFIRTSKRTEIEFYESSELTEKPNPIAIPIPSSVCNKEAASTCEKTMPKYIHFATDDSKAGISGGFCSPIVSKATSRSIDDGTVFKNDSLPSKPPKGKPATKGPLASATSPKSFKGSATTKSSSETAYCPTLASKPSKGNPATNISLQSKCSMAFTSKRSKGSQDTNSFVKTPSFPILESTLLNLSLATKNSLETAAPPTLASNTSKESHPGNKFLETVSSSTASNNEPNAVDCNLVRAFDLLHLHVDNLLPFFNYLMEIQQHLKHVYYIMGNMQYVVQNIQVYKNCGCEQLRECIIGVVTLASELLGRIGLHIMDADLKISICDAYFKEASKNTAFVKPIVSSGHITNEKLKVYVQEMEIIVKKLDEIIPGTDSWRSLFLSTAVDLVKSVNLFVKCLIAAKILNLC